MSLALSETMKTRFVTARPISALAAPLCDLFQYIMCWLIFTFQDRIVKLLGDLHSYHKSFFPVMRCLHILVAKLPKQPLGKQVSWFKHILFV